jgi:prophage antirepressor-like protein
MSFEDMAAAAQDPKSLPVEFEFDTTHVRTIAKEGQAWFVAKDVCDILEIGDPSKAVGRLEEDETGTTTIRTTAGPRELLTVNESGLYSLIFTASPKPSASERVTNEVRPPSGRPGDTSAIPRRTPIPSSSG